MKIYSEGLSEREPSFYEWEKVCYVRRNTNFYSKKRETQFKHIEACVSGEQRALDYICQNVPSSWSVIRNFWIDYHGTCEFDLILVNDTNQIFLFEVKKYRGVFSYDNGECRINGQVIAHNCVAQARKALINLQAICREISPHLEVNGILLFIGQDSWVELKSEIEQIQVITGNQFLFFLKRIVTKSMSEKSTFNTIEKVLRACERYKTENPFSPKSIDSEMFKQLRKGIYCESCRRFNLRVETCSM